jgi:hypothetical protein
LQSSKRREKSAANMSARVNDHMSKIKSPSEKKRLSLKHDRRNTYGENSKSSRKSIAKSKQRRHMDERRGVGQLLDGLRGIVDEDAAAKVELEVKVTIADSRNRGFKKVPDMPLGLVLARKKEKSAGRK